MRSYVILNVLRKLRIKLLPLLHVLRGNSYDAITCCIMIQCYIISNCKNESKSTTITFVLRQTVQSTCKYLKEIDLSFLEF